MRAASVSGCAAAAAFNASLSARSSRTTVADGGVVRGTEWRFTTGAELACSITPHPPPVPPKPGPVNCRAAEQALCPGLAHTGAQVGGKCYACVVRNSKALAEAGCFTRAGKGGRHAFVVEFCGK